MEKGEKGAWAKGQLEGVQTTMEQMIATGVSLGVHVMTNQGGKAWGDVIKLTSSVAQLDSYNLFRKNKTEEQAKPEDSKNAFYKSIDSFKEIGTGFVGTLRTRADKATDSPYDFFNWLTLGITGDIPVGIYEAAKDRSEHMFDSKEKFADWLTLGTVEMAKGAFNPDEAWSADHWLNSLGMVTLLYGPAEKSLLSTEGGLLKPKLPKEIDLVQETIDFKLWEEIPVSGQNKLTTDGLRIMSIKDIKKFKSEMNLNNIKVIMDKKGTILPEKAVGGFNPNTGQIVLRPDASYLSVVHESYHAKHFGELGKENYMKLSTLEKEEYVYREIMKNKGELSIEEIYEAQRYIFKLRNGQWPLSNWKGFDE